MVPTTLLSRHPTEWSEALQSLLPQLAYNAAVIRTTLASGHTHPQLKRTLREELLTLITLAHESVIALDDC